MWLGSSPGCPPCLRPSLSQPPSLCAKRVTGRSAPRSARAAAPHCERPGGAMRRAGMAGPLLALCLALASAAGPGASFSAPLGDIGACQKRCGHPPGAARLFSSSLQDAVLNACYRGCRLFSICHFVDASAELNTTRAECESACVEAYGSAEEQFGCTTGCRKQLPETQSWKDKVSLQPVSFSMFDLVSSFCNDIVSSAQSFISSTWTFYLQADDGKVVVFQVGQDHAAEVISGPAWLWEQGMEPHASRQKLIKTKLQHLETQQPEHDFLGCMSKRSGLPRWILAACLFLSIMVMLWLSCASLVTAPDQHVKTQLSVLPGPAWPLTPMPGAARFSSSAVPFSAWLRTDAASL
uniref:Transmembrane protein 59 like n=1 Tax=Chelonoidis abingdonii TaxID=106734 RepID=A0A8C0HEC0_CHEAB